MRDRKEILSEFEVRNQYSEFKRHNEQILEVLLDIRELLKTQNDAPQIKVKISEAQEPSITFNPQSTKRFPGFDKVDY